MDPVQMPSLRLNTPAAQGRSSGEATLAVVAGLVASGLAASKVELANLTGVSRSAITAAVDRLLRSRVLHLSGSRPRSGRGRPADALAVSPEAGTVLVFDCGATSARLAVTDVGQRILAERTVALDVAMGPIPALGILADHMHSMLEEVGVNAGHQCIVIGLPARMDYQARIPVRPAIMPGWDGFRVSDPLQADFGCPVIVESDANLRALGEARVLPEDQSPLLAIKVGTGIGAGLVTDGGRLYRGSAGAAGEIGHVTLRSAPPTRCVCGNIACLEAVASVPALLQRYDEESHSEKPCEPRQLAALLAAGDPTAVSVVRETARYLGEAIADVVNVFNPVRVVLHGPTTSASDDLLAGVRSMVYEHARPLATRNLQIAFSVLGERAGIAGAMVLGLEYLLSPAALSSHVATGLDAGNRAQ
ncbi:MAG: ROK family protein [Arachnia sp.]